MTSRETARAIAECALVKRAGEVIILDLRNLSDVTDYFVICTGETDVQVKAIADAIDEGMRERGVHVWKTEGYGGLQWVLLDFVDVVCHVFQPRVRSYYNLEKLWGDAPVEYIEESPPPTADKGSPT
ncbi:MAG: ribosome silencing factor [Bacteroidota bacterium]|nr:ribosome silencing factor [Bacteroidota bacterium]